MVVGHVGLKFISILIAILTKEEIITILTHVTILQNLFCATETLEFSIDWP